MRSLNEMTIEELKQELTAQGIEFDKKAKKDQLISLLESTQEPQSNPNSNSSKNEFTVTVTLNASHPTPTYGRCGFRFNKNEPKTIEVNSKQLAILKADTNIKVSE